MSKFIETSQYLKELNALWDKHATHISKANTNLNALLKNASKLPSTYISNLVKLSAAQDAVTASSKKLTAETLKQAREITSLLAKKNALLSANKNLAKAVAELEAKLKKANAELEKMKSTSTSTTAAQNALTNSIRNTERTVENLNRRVQQSNAVMAGFRLTLGGVNNLMSAFGISTGLFLAVGIAKNIYETTKQLQSMDLALKMVSETQSRYAANVAFINTISEKWGLETKSTTEQFTKFYADAKGKLSEVEIQEVYEGIAKAGSIMGLSLEKQKSAFTAFQQMLSKGTIQAQELKLQLGDALPGSIKVATQAYQKLHPELKVTEALLYKHMEQGKLISSEMIPEMVKGYQKLYGIENSKGIDTLMAQQNRLKNSWTELVRSMNESETGGISIFFGYITTAITNGLNLLTRYNSEWDTLFKKARSEGNQFGFDEFKVEGKSKEQLIKDKDYIYLQAKDLSAKIVELKKKFAGEGFLSEINPFSDTGGEIEKLMQEKGQMEGAIRRINAVLIASKPKPKVKNAKQEEEEQKLAEKERKAREERERANAKAQEKEDRDSYNAALSKLQHEKFLLEQKALLKSNSYSENIGIATEIGLKEQEIAKFVHDEQIRLAKGSLDLKIIADNKYYEEKIRLAKAFIDRINAVEFKPQYRDSAKVADEETYGSGVFETDKDAYGAMSDLWKKQQDEKDKIAAREKERLIAMRDVLNDIFKEFGQATGFEKTMDMFGKVGRNGKTFWENLTGGKEGKIELKEGLTAGLTLTQDIGNKIFDGEQKRTEARMELLELQKDEAIKNAGDSASAKAAIEEEYEKKAKELRKKEAASKKKQAIFNIGLDTAQAIMGLWVKPGFPAAIPLVAAVGALGIAQMAIAASRPLPSFYVGTDNAPEGYANTDEFGAELHLDKDGRIKDLGSNNGPRIKYLESGDKIIPAAKTAEILKGNDYSSLDEILLLNNILYNNDKNNQLDTSGIISSINTLTETVLNKESSEEHYDVRGWTKYTKSNGRKIESKNNRIRFKKSII